MNDFVKVNIFIIYRLYKCFKFIEFAIKLTVYYRLTSINWWIWVYSLTFIFILLFVHNRVYFIFWFGLWFHLILFLYLLLLLQTVIILLIQKHNSCWIKAFSFVVCAFILVFLLSLLTVWNILILDSVFGVSILRLVFHFMVDTPRTKKCILVFEELVDVDRSGIKLNIFDFYFVEVSVLIVFIISTKCKSIKHLQVLKHLFIFVD